MKSRCFWGVFAAGQKKKKKKKKPIKQKWKQGKKNKNKKVMQKKCNKKCHSHKVMIYRTGASSRHYTCDETCAVNRCSCKYEADNSERNNSHCVCTLFHFSLQIWLYTSNVTPNTTHKKSSDFTVVFLMCLKCVFSVTVHTVQWLTANENTVPDEPVGILHLSEWVTAEVLSKWTFNSQ